jgi:hypothetical protein
VGLVDRPGKLFGLDSHGLGAPGTNEIFFRLNPNELMDRLMAATRADDFDLSGFDHQLISVG